MDAPEGFALRLWHLLAFLPFFLLLLLLAIVKAAFIAPIVFVVIFVGNTILIIGLYPCHAVWSCYCIARTKKFGSLLKVFILLLMPVLILLWPCAAMIGTILTGLGFGIALPLMATFEAVRGGVQNKFLRCFTVRILWIFCILFFSTLCFYFLKLITSTC